MEEFTKKIELKDELLKTSTLIAIEKDKKDRDEIKAIYKFTNNFRYKGKDYMVYIVIREGQNGLIYYDHGVIKEKNLNKSPAPLCKTK